MGQHSTDTPQWVRTPVDGEAAALAAAHAVTVPIVRATPSDAGVIVDGAAWSAQQVCLATIQYALDHGMPHSPEDAGMLLRVTAGAGSADDDQGVDDWADEAVEFLNREVAPDSHAYTWHPDHPGCLMLWPAWRLCELDGERCFCVDAPPEHFRRPATV